MLSTVSHKFRRPLHAMPKRTTCDICNKAFKTHRALEQHCRDAHSDDEESSDDDVYAPPYPDACGEWVIPRRCNAQKSFGRFECFRCNQQWQSAHTHRARPNKQQCKRCDHWVPPALMWNNCGQRTITSVRGNDDKPHLRDRCEACRAGTCLL